MLICTKKYRQDTVFNTVHSNTDNIGYLIAVYILVALANPMMLGGGQDQPMARFWIVVQKVVSTYAEGLMSTQLILLFLITSGQLILTAIYFPPPSLLHPPSKI